MNLFVVILLIFCLSFDVLLASFSYGIDKIKIPLKSIILMNLIITILFVTSNFFGELISLYVEQSVLNIISFFILFVLSLCNFFKYSIKKYFLKLNNKKFTLYNINFIMQVAVDSTLADSDNSKILSLKEAISLGVALSLDGITVALSIGFFFNNYIILFLTSFVITISMFIIGNILGCKFSKKMDINLSWLSGIIFLILAITKIV